MNSKTLKQVDIVDMVRMGFVHENPEGARRAKIPVFPWWTVMDDRLVPVEIRQADHTARFLVKHVKKESCIVVVDQGSSAYFPDRSCMYGASSCSISSSVTVA